ncbi:hypothetical protein [Frondihabitans peucedani]|uniref:Uncharacterized protein n=1 Tax=Frondihabitans peucedani TaxID=598626 RepID=A0ABP8DXN8_9MICO
MAGRFLGSLFGRPPVEVVDDTPVDEVQADAERAARELDALRALVRRSGALLPPVVSSRLRHLDDLLRVVLQAADAEDASTEQRYLLDAMIRDYLPTPLHSYLALPESDRAVTAGPTVLLLGQLEVLEETVRDLLNQIRIHAIAELSTHGRFLADKFDGPSLVLDSPSSTSS